MLNNIFNKKPVDLITIGTAPWPFTKEFPFIQESKGFWGALFLSALTATGVPWWFGPVDDFFARFGISPAEYVFLYVSYGDLFFFGSLGVCAVLLVALSYILVRTRRSLKMKQMLHKMAHLVRDKQVEAYEAQAEQRKYSESIEQISDELCNLIKEYFEILIPRSDIKAAVRLWNGESYITYGRSGGFSAHRRRYSEPLLPHSGLANILRYPATNRGVYFIHDLAFAIRNQIYQQHETDRRFPEDYKTLMVAPINGWDGNGIALIGILFIVSKEKSVFKPKHVDSVGFVADLCSTLYGSVVNELPLQKV